MIYCTVLPTTPRHVRFVSTVHQPLLASAALLCTALPAYGDLRTIESLNEAQRNLAGTVHTICPQLAANTTRTAQEENLFIACNRMIHTSNELQGAGPIDNSLGLTENQLVTAMDELTHEETVARVTKGRDTAELQHSNIATRLGSLRTGGTRGTGAVSLHIGDRWLTAESDPAAALRGGATGDEDSSRLSIFISGGAGFGDKSATSREDGFTYDDLGATLGADYALDARTFVGAAAGYSRTEADFENTADEAQTDSASVSLYGTHFMGTWFFDIIATYGEDDYDTTRDTSLLAETLNAQESAVLQGSLPSRISSTTSGSHTGFSVGVGRNVEAGPIVWSPYALYSYYSAEVDAYSEEGDSGIELTLPKQEIKSSQGILGIDVTRSISSKVGIISPQLRLEYHRQFDYDSVAYPARYKWDNTQAWWTAPSDEADHQYIVLGAGVSLVARGGMQTFAYYENVQGLHHYSANVLILGWRMEL